MRGSQVVSGVLVTTDLTLTNGVNTVNLVATQLLSSLGSSVLATTIAAGMRTCPPISTHTFWIYSPIRQSGPRLIQYYPNTTNIYLCISIV